MLRQMAIHLLSHGAPGSLVLGAAVLNSANLADYSTSLAQIGSHLTGTGDLLIYGCNVAQGEEGMAFVDALSAYTGADVAVSEDLTGAAVLGGDAVLEVA